MVSEDVLKKNFCIFGYISLGIIISFHMITSFQYRIENGRLPKSVYWSFALCFIALWHCMQLSSRTFELTNNPYSCFFLGTFGPAMYALLHLNLYLLFISRIHEAYGHTPVATNPKKLAIWTILIVIWGLINMSMIIIPRVSHVSTNFNTATGKCQPYSLDAIMDPYFRPSVTSLNVICCIVNTFLFIRPIHLLSKKLDTSTSTHVDKTVSELRLLSIKQCILSCVATVSTIVAMVGIAETDYSAAIWLPFDWILTLSSVILMYSWNNKYTDILCCCLYSYAKFTQSSYSLSEFVNSRKATPTTETGTTIGSNVNSMVIHEYSVKSVTVKSTKSVAIDMEIAGITNYKNEVKASSMVNNPLKLVKKISNQVSNRLAKKNSKTELGLKDQLNLKNSTSNINKFDEMDDTPQFKLKYSQSEPVPTYLMKSHTRQKTDDNFNIY